MNSGETVWREITAKELAIIHSLLSDLCFHEAMKSIGLYYFRVLAVLGKLCGTFPLQRVRSIGRKGEALQFRYCSLAFLYGLICIPLTICLPVIIAGCLYILSSPHATWYDGLIQELVSVTSGTGTTGQIAQIIQIAQGCFIICTVYCVNIFKAKQIPKLLERLEQLEMKIGLLPEDQMRLRRFSSIDLNFTYICKFLEAISVSNVTTLKQSLTNYNRTTSDRRESESKLSIAIEDTRQRYFQVSDAVEHTSSVFHPAMLIRFFNGISVITVTIYLCAENWERERVLHVVDQAALVFALSALLFVVSKAGGNVSERTEALLKEVSKECGVNLSPQIWQQMQGFQMQVSSHPLRITASNYFTIDKGILTAAFGTIVTYLVVLLQFRLEEIMDDSLPSNSTGIN
ncbi:unnamed protein product [Darwinula stevensoni]|uniref:Gustatory receptor n=1 Tax=Darwinula stevensoni TaxID=69355 RepID=A0A7R8XFT9_9CRUS|nr:unnamed protein product [Darwinula stevensoni]CAG0889115.1 unnamed protein product [Darwinula stevensoni]